jgi:hypothetical protein
MENSEEKIRLELAELLKIEKPTKVLEKTPRINLDVYNGTRKGRLTETLNITLFSASTFALYLENILGTLITGKDISITDTSMFKDIYQSVILYKDKIEKIKKKGYVLARFRVDAFDEEDDPDYISLELYFTRLESKEEKISSKKVALKNKEQKEKDKQRKIDNLKKEAEKLGLKVV